MFIQQKMRSDCGAEVPGRHGAGGSSPSTSCRCCCSAPLAACSALALARGVADSLVPGACLRRLRPGRLWRDARRRRCRRSASALLVSLLFALVPLLEIRRVKPLLLLRDETARPAPAAAVRGGAIGAGSATWTGCGSASGSPCVALAALAGWQAASWRIGLIVSGGFVGVAIVLFVAGARAGLGGAAAAPRRLVPAAPRDHRLRPAGQPDARHPARGRARQLLHPRRAAARGEPAAASSRSTCGPTRRTCF